MALRLPGMDDDVIRACLLDLAARRGAEKTFCPSEAARALAGDWRPLMPLVRAAAFELVSEGRLSVLQSGQVVSPTAAKGAIRLGMKR